MGFDPDKYLAAEEPKAQSTGFDPDAYLSDKPKQEESKSARIMDSLTDLSPLHAISKRLVKAAMDDPKASQAALEHFGNSASLGYLPQLQAGAEKPMSYLLDKITGNHVSDDLPPYVQRRDDNIKRLEQEAKNSPHAALAGDIGGALASGAATSALMPIKGATLAARAAQAAGSGAALGAAYNPGDTEGEENWVQPVDRAKNAAISGALSLPLHLAGEGVSKLGEMAAGKAKGFAEGRAAGALGFTKGQLKKEIENNGKDAILKLGRTALDEGIVTPNAGPKTMMERAEAAKNIAGKTVGSLIETADAQSAPKISARDIALELSDDPGFQRLAKTPGQKQIYNQVMDHLNTLYSNGDELTLKEAQALRQGIDEAINFNKPIPEMSGTQSHLYDMRDSLKNGINASVDQLAANGGQAAGQLKDANRLYSHLSDIEKATTQRTAAETANKFLGLTDTLSGATGAAVGGYLGDKVGGYEGAKTGALLGAGVGALGGKVARTYGNQAVAYSADQLSKFLAGSPKLAALIQKNPAIAPMLMNSLKGKDQSGPKPEDISPALMGYFQQNPEMIDSLSDEKLKDQVRQRMGRQPADEPRPLKEAQQKFLQGN